MTTKLVLTGSQGVAGSNPASSTNPQTFQPLTATLQQDGGFSQLSGQTFQTFQGVTFKKAVERYLRAKTTEGKSAASYIYLTVLWGKSFSETPIQAISSDDIQDSLDEYCEKRKLSPASRRLALAQLSGLFSFALNRDWVLRHPIQGGRVPKPKVNNARERWLRVHEIQKLLQFCPAWLAAIVTFTAKTGMRLNEVCSLTRESFSIDNQDRAFLRTGVTKNGTCLTWPLEGTLRDEIEAKVSGLEKGALLFPGPQGGNAAMSIKRHFKAAVEAAGMEWGKTRTGITFHTLRHSMASLAVNSGVPLNVVKRMGNWKSDSIVARYAHLADETFRAASSHMDKLVDGK